MQNEFKSQNASPKRLNGTSNAFMTKEIHQTTILEENEIMPSERVSTNITDLHYSNQQKLTNEESRFNKGKGPKALGNNNH